MSCLAEVAVMPFCAGAMIPSSSLTAFCVLQLFRRKVGITLGHGQCFVTQQFLQCSNVHAPHCQMAGVGVPQIVEPKIRNARLPARRSEAVHYIPDVPAVPIAENIPCLLRHLRQDSVERVVDRDYP